MQSVEAGCYKESGAVDAVCDCEGGFVVFYCLEKGKVEAQENGKGEGVNSFFSVSFHNTVVSSCNCYTRS